jgi:AcrR family transcriptional regulator
MNPTNDRRRAPGMRPEERREMVVRAALPLVAEYGAAVTTAQVARAAGIGEATIFRVFADKDELLSACVAEALDVTHLERELRSVPMDQPLAARLADAADALRAYQDRMGSVIGALLASGHHRRPPPPGRDELAASREAARLATTAAVADLFAPDRAALRLPIETLAEIFLLLVSGPSRTPGPAVSVTDLVTLFLHGALADPREAS